MDSIKLISPIFIAKTRSFWLGVLPATLTLVDVLFQALTSPGSEPVAAALALVLQPITGWSAEQISGTMRTLAPLYALIVAQQRAGLSRPYTLDPKKEQTIQEVVEDGLSAFDAGRKFGEAIKGRSH